ncbi:YggS family pyridoxal phosphate-dependent enzyme [Zhongshania guokunii]|uniref:Pyridoxal phosphate homeostasis protein n=1 Tax=Zhongshania guokunii TaxID=641783 RepID=A0ABV3U9H0_9GAMM
MTASTTIIANIAAIQARIAAAQQYSASLTPHLTLMAVSKTRSAEDIAAALKAGIEHIGENYLQEAVAKQAELQDKNICWHFIGPIQSNKTRTVAEHFSWVHSVDRAKILSRLNEQRPPALGPLNICLQVNINNEPSKAGASIADIPALAELALSLPQLRLRGLMAIPANTDDPAQQRRNFAAVRKLLNSLRQHFPAAQLDTLSMGMSGDMEAAIAEGATILRIGSDIFGPRASPAPE